ncbi:hypothetical protein CP10743SC13_1863, partial [Chlamydia psittaci 10_743_SC13]
MFTSKIPHFTRISSIFSSKNTLSAGPRRRGAIANPRLRGPPPARILFEKNAFARKSRVFHPKIPIFCPEITHLHLKNATFRPEKQAFSLRKFYPQNTHFHPKNT